MSEPATRSSVKGAADLDLVAPVAALDAYMNAWLEERALPDNLRAAVRYALLGQGKRMRPILVIRSAEAVGGDAGDAMAPAAAIEMIHAFSLVHDDLPAMDDDDLRRGRPTLHRQTSEAMAILAGDALMGLAVELILTRVQDVDMTARLCRELITATNDMVAGQVYDTLPEFDPSVGSTEKLETIHRHKTGALIRGACRLGGMAGGADEQQLAALTAYGETIGLMFQVVDDLLDVTATTEDLGKTAGKDADQHKLTYPGVLGIEASRREVVRLRDVALASLGVLASKADPLRQLCEYFAVRMR